jgi:hypothetical protein
VKKVIILMLSLFILGCATTIYFKPVVNRYIFDKNDEGYIIKDSATGKIYFCVLWPMGGTKQLINIYDPIKNKYFLKITPPEKLIK